MKKPFYITTAIAYTSRKPHVGNNYEIVLTDAIARYKRETGYDVYFLTGTDEHGQKIQRAAEEKGISPQAYVDEISGQIRAICDLLNCSYDGFIRTTDEQHVKTVQKIFKKFYDQGDIYKSEYEGHYCVPCESFFTETQLVDGCCPDCGRKVEKTKEVAYFFKMSKYQARLMQYIEEHPDFIQPESRKKEMVNNFLKPGLQDLCVSRTSFTWGIPVEFDPGHVIYVWIDALSNYITALGYDPDGSSELYKKYWPADHHIIGKDILRFHTIYWPIMLMALGEPLPKQVFGHPWMLFDNDKMSKSKGNVIYAEDLVRHFGVDAVRYYMLHEMPFAQDGSITQEVFIARYNSDLANVLGNLVNRCVAMVTKYFDGEIRPQGELTDLDNELIALANSLPEKLEAQMTALHVADAIDEIWTLARRLNKYIDETMPWVLAKENTARLETVLYNLIEGIRIIGVALRPFLPETAEKILAQIGAQKTTWEEIGFTADNAGLHVGKAEVLFARLDEAAKLAELQAEQAQNAEPVREIAPIKPEITIEDFAKLDLRVAKVLACEPVKKADKLYCLQLELGGEIRQVVSGIAKHYMPEQLVGKNVIVVANLKPVKLRGVESCGMILAAADDEKLQVVTVDDMPSGTEVC